MPPLVGDDSVVAAATDDLQSRIAQIALQARKRNPMGYKMTASPSSSPPSTPPRARTFVNTYSGQEIALLDTAQNVPGFLEEFW
ncbi:Hypothetical Protein FCC1311_001992 [Hondaea fermentalgiana]|uniref:Uncharacterized protein n=1 Tax=Hondaea fermentalgiana TaxID=2315210 RepID=A0A2R5FZ24_9STRA|nr:Hypothetical Protein FCC1311_001992 [Hondaea fermentalgiana]|eukprot:GBG23980.1 Hypothetical Protein FCC1311_001992 [Hondaea fermentalgiana]